MTQPVKDLPWPRGDPPKFKDTVPKYSEPHWKTSAVYKCASCGSQAPCVHKNKYMVLMNSKFQEGEEHRPNFMLEGPQWRTQLSKVEQAGGKLKNGQPLPPGTRHGWGSYPGSDALVGSPRRYGEWKLVYVPGGANDESSPKPKSEKPRSRSQLSYRSQRNDDPRTVEGLHHQEILSHRNRVVSPYLGPYSTVQNMDYHTASQAKKDDYTRAWKNFGCTTPDLVREFNETLPQLSANARSARAPNATLDSRHQDRTKSERTARSRNDAQAMAVSARTGSDASEWMDKTTREKRVKKLLDEMPERLRSQMEGRDIPSVAEETDDKVGGLPVPHFRQRKPGEALESFYWMQSRKPKRKKKLKGERAFRW